MIGRMLLAAPVLGSLSETGSSTSELPERSWREAQAAGRMTEARRRPLTSLFASAGASRIDKWIPEGTNPGGGEDRHP